MPKKLDRIFGFLKHEDEEVPFFFSTDTFQLVLYPAASNECGGFSLKAFERMADDSQKNKWTDNPEIEGMTSEEYHIIFCISGIPAYKNSLIEYKANWAFYWAGEHYKSQVMMWIGSMIRQEFLSRMQNLMKKPEDSRSLLSEWKRPLLKIADIISKNGGRSAVSCNRP